jgi:hypothetical protein
MQKIIVLAAAAASFAIAAPALGQAYPGAQPSTSSSGAGTKTPAGDPAGDPTANSSAAAGMNASTTAGSPSAIASGMSVKDKTGATIGQVTDVKADATGQQLATVKMGADTFTVETSKLAVQDGAATINATQAELKKMIPKR